CPQIVRRNEKRADASRVGSNGLPIGKINQRKQDDDRDHHRQDEVNAAYPEREEQHQCGFRAIRRRTQGVQTKDCNTWRRTYLLRALLARSQRLSKKKIKNPHSHTNETKLSAA